MADTLKEAAEREKHGVHTEHSTHVTPDIVKEETAPDGLPVKIVVDTQHDQRLNPGSPDFSLTAWREALSELMEPGERLNDYVMREINGNVSSITKTIGLALESLKSYFESDGFKMLSEALANLEENAISDDAFNMGIETGRKLKQLSPFLTAALHEAHQQGKYLDTNVFQLVYGCFDLDGNPVEEFEPLLKRAQELKKEVKIVGEVTEVAENIEHIAGHAVKKWTHPIDKTSGIFFGANQQDADTDRWPLPTITVGLGSKSPRASKKSKELTLSYNFTFEKAFLEEHGLGERFTVRDLFVQAAIYNLMLQGNRQITPTMIFRAMGNSSSPGKTQIKPIIESINKQMQTLIVINNKKAAEAWGFDTYRETTEHLLPVRIVNEKIRINGRIAQSYIEVLDIPPLMRLAENMRQITSVPIGLLDINNVSKTDSYYAVLNYVLTAIAHMKREKNPRSRKIVYDTLFNSIGAKTKDQKAAAMVVLYKILDHFKAEKHISGYEDEKATVNKKLGVLIHLPAVKAAE